MRLKRRIYNIYLKSLLRK